MNRKVKHIDKNIVDVTKARPASSKAVRDFRTRLSKVGNSPLAYELELLKGFAKSNVKGAYVFPLLIIAITVISIQWVPIAMSFPWAASAIAVANLPLVLERFVRFKVQVAGGRPDRVHHAAAIVHAERGIERDADHAHTDHRREAGARQPLDAGHSAHMARLGHIDLRLGLGLAAELNLR